MSKFIPAKALAREAHMQEVRRIYERARLELLKKALEAKAKEKKDE